MNRRWFRLLLRGRGGPLRISLVLRARLLNRWLRLLWFRLRPGLLRTLRLPPAVILLVLLRIYRATLQRETKRQVYW